MMFSKTSLMVLGCIASFSFRAVSGSAANDPLQSMLDHIREKYGKVPVVESNCLSRMRNKDGHGLITPADLKDTNVRKALVENASAAKDLPNTHPTRIGVFDSIKAIREQANDT